MKRLMLVVGLLALMVLGSAGPASAWRRGGFRHHPRHHSRSVFVFGFGAPFFYGYPAYGAYPYYYGYPAYSYPPGGYYYTPPPAYYSAPSYSYPDPSYPSAAPPASGYPSPAPPSSWPSAATPSDSSPPGRMELRCDSGGFCQWSVQPTN